MSSDQYDDGVDGGALDTRVFKTFAVLPAVSGAHVACNAMHVVRLSFSVVFLHCACSMFLPRASASSILAFLWHVAR